MVQACATTGKPAHKKIKLGADPMASWAKLRDNTLAALDQQGALQRIAEEPFGPEFGSFPVDGLVGFMAAETVVHAWDLARTAKVDESLDPGLCKAALATWRSLPEPVLRSEGMFGTAIKSEKGADPQTRLLNFLGRKV
jgi:uncharacterized protein (TIGR03086 family)